LRCDLLRINRILRSTTYLCCQLAYANPGTVNSAVPVPVKSTGVQLILVLPQDEKS
jgi:hypothetical protein